MGAIAPGVEGCIYNLGISPTQQRRDNTGKDGNEEKGKMGDKWG